MAEVIRVSGAREHNLKDISVEIPRDNSLLLRDLVVLVNRV